MIFHLNNNLTHPVANDLRAAAKTAREAIIHELRADYLTRDIRRLGEMRKVLNLINMAINEAECRGIKKRPRKCKFHPPLG